MPKFLGSRLSPDKRRRIVKRLKNDFPQDMWIIGAIIITTACLMQVDSSTVTILGPKHRVTSGLEQMQILCSIESERNSRIDHITFCSKQNTVYYTWNLFDDKENIFENPRYQTVRRIMDATTMRVEITIHNVTCEDHQVFSCFANFTNEDERYANYTLNVVVLQKPPTVELIGVDRSLGEIEVLLGSLIQIVFTAILAKTEHDRIEWRFLDDKGHPKSPQDLPNVTYQSEKDTNVKIQSKCREKIFSYLSFPAVKSLGDFKFAVFIVSGNATGKRNISVCSAPNRDMCAKTKLIKVRYPVDEKRLTVKIHPSVIELDKPLTLECIAEGMPEPLIMWYKINLEKARKYMTSKPKLKIKKFAKKDYGKYICMAQNMVMGKQYTVNRQLTLRSDDKNKRINISEISANLKESGEQFLSTASIAGIVVGVIVLFTIVAATHFYVSYRRKQNDENIPEEEDTETTTSK